MSLMRSLSATFCSAELVMRSARTAGQLGQLDGGHPRPQRHSKWQLQHRNRECEHQLYRRSRIH